MDDRLLAQSIPARIVAIASHLPEAILDNEALSADFPEWSADKILEKTGIAERRIAAPNETALDLGEAAARKLIEKTGIEPDFIIFCSQAPDYILPSSACILQHRLSLAKTVGALDMNLGCSGFVYGLSLAAGLISAGTAKNVMLITADTYSKFIHPRDRSVRTLFGDAAAATLLQPSSRGSSLGPFLFGTDGGGADDLIVETGGARAAKTEQSAIELKDSFGNIRSRDNLYMNGSAVLNFTLREVPKIFDALLDRAKLTCSDIDHVVLHQANLFMLEALRKKMKLPKDVVPYYFETVGNTVSSTIPLVLESLMNRGALPERSMCALIGFGVGLSWAATVWVV